MSRNKNSKNEQPRKNRLLENIFSLRNSTDKRHKIICLMGIKLKINSKHSINKQTIKPCINFEEVLSEFEPKKYTNKKIDIVVPVFNGFEYLEPLFNSVFNNTDLDFELFVIDDCSPDERVAPYLDSLKNIFKEKLHLFKNNKNLGFLKSVNKLLSKTKNDVVIINTDVVLPPNWASRLMTPIYKNPKVASVTPFSNAATIFSFPEIFKDNDLEYDFLQVDECLSRINAQNVPTINFPTGVGFCMAMSRAALDKIGVFDEIFEKGYGEENDWCMRAINHGFLNTFAPNLFVFHKHGGSFPSKEKADLCKKHLKILKRRYPKYFKLVAKSENDRTYQDLRFLSTILYANKFSQKTYLYFDLNLGGGTEHYFYQKTEELENENLIIRIQYPYGKNYRISVYFKGLFSETEDSNFENIMNLLKKLKIDEIILNHVIMYDLKYILEKIDELKQILKTKVSMKCHDYYSICNDFNLMGKNKDKVCDYQNCTQCENCFKNQKKNFDGEICSIQDYRAIWSKFLEKTVDEFEVFSNKSREIAISVYPQIAAKISVNPHKVKSLGKADIQPHDSINIAALGWLCAIHKGRNIVGEIEKIIDNYEGVNFIVIGSYDSSNSKIRVTGQYDLNELKNIVEKEQIDCIFIPSIWHETLIIQLPKRCRWKYLSLALMWEQFPKE